MPIPRERQFSTREKLSSPSQPDSSQPSFTPSLTQLPLCARKRPGFGFGLAFTLRSRTVASLSCQNTNYRRRNASTPSLSGSLAISPHRNSTCTSAFPPLRKATSASTSSAPFCQTVLQADPDHDSRLTSLLEEWWSHRDCKQAKDSLEYRSKTFKRRARSSPS